MATTSARPSARLLDLTRLVRRVGQLPTGIDRVERAYLEALLGEQEPLWALIRSSLGYVLLDRQGCAGLLERVRSGQWGARDRLSRMTRGVEEPRGQAESDLRRICVARCLPIRLGRMLARYLPAGTAYLNVGHSSVSDRVITAVRRIPGSRIAVMVHDTIPLDLPRMQRPRSVTRFAAFFNRVIHRGDLVICPSETTRQAVLRHAAPVVPQVVVAPLGVTQTKPGVALRGPWDGAPFFVTVGTIEPRKNHALLLDIWPEIPKAHLLICGHRGWRNDAVFATLDARPERVHELSGLDDATVSALIRDACGFLFPSIAEGYGLPPLEAAAQGGPVIVADLAVYDEVLGAAGTRLDPHDPAEWRAAIMALATAKAPHRARIAFHPPDWPSHFKTVLTLT
ncbi:glycosyltransferase family 1 protein [Cognatishimia sp. F0-27]|uniref:glycosyltransferase family 4 protein n=1 Tax=Cognatishimia sp. F0-27 TaxID=2816855 RepID=UPI001D0C102D|nr:glycosyltransferase family 1 protein [Cognatishimia sp. F0-27]MCC1491287.1 glycosyltransferase family 4 protein [Cognatishimia sp. F0-27]